MENTELKKKLEETKSKIKANSKDAHFADALISDLLSLKGQMTHEPTVVHYELKDVEDTVSGNTFEISTMKDGTAIYHVYGGYTIIADVRTRTLNLTLRSMLDILKNHHADDEPLLVDAIGHVLAIPMVAFSDSKFTYKLAADVLEWINSMQDKLIDAELVAEDPNAHADIARDVTVGEQFKNAFND